MAGNTPVVVNLPQHQTRIIIALENDQFEITGDGHSATISGNFAQSLNQLLTGSAQHDDLLRLQTLEKQYKWLHGLSQATIHIQPRQLLIGESLGMLFIEVTDQCNERCIHCYASSSPDCHDFLSLDEIKHTLDVARVMGRPFVQFTGGDPLIHKQLVQAVEYAKKLDFQGIEIYTNGLLLSDAMLDKLTPFQPRLSFSIYADTAECHDAITQVPGSWKRTIAAMKRAKQAGFEIRAGIALMPENIECVDRMVNFLHTEIGLRAEHVRFDPVKQTGRGEFMDGASQILIAPSHAPKSGDVRRGKLCVAADGNVYPCIFARQTCLGNIRKQPLDHIIAQLEQRQVATPSAESWKSCRESLSCGDCQIIAYALGKSAGEHS
ncbi:MAG: radical SAM protein [Mariprofundaceae bacterium]